LQILLFFSLKSMYNKNMKILLASLFALVLLSCDHSPSESQRFAYDLLGTWETHEESAVYQGSLEISYNHIIIKEYGEDQTPKDADDSRRPFSNFIKNVPLEAYSKDGHIFIKAYGTWQSGIPYTYWTTPAVGVTPRQEFLRFSFGGRNEDLRKIEP